MTGAIVPGASSGIGTTIAARFRDPYYRAGWDGPVSPPRRGSA